MEKVTLQNNLVRKPSNSSYMFLLDVNFENVIIGFHVFYYIIYAYKIPIRSIINSYVINQMFKFQIFVV